MKCSPRPRYAASAIVAAFMALAPTSPVGAEPAGPDVPDKIAVAAGHQVFLVAHAVGDQNYTCTTTSTGPRWSSAVPSAELYGDNGQVLGTHYAGPTWEARDGSTVKATRVDGVTKDTSAIPWLLLAKSSTTVGADGARMTNTAFIQRVNTTGGLQPGAELCTTANVGTTVGVPYTADYYFWKETGN
jgi:FtsP/CotA-like multicopper oxidase with cupredoxin domain